MKKVMLTVFIALIAIGTNAQISRSFVHTADSASGHVSRMYHPDLNGVNNYYMLCTHNLNMGGSTTTINDNKTGLYYLNKKWFVFNENFADLDTNLAFNIFIPGSDVKSWAHKATASNSDLNYTVIDHPNLNGDSNALVFITDNWNPLGAPGVYNTAIVGVFYSTHERKWCIFNEDGFTPIKEKTSYNIVIPNKNSAIERFVHKADGNNVTENWTEIDHPDANGNPDAQLFVTQNWNPGGGSGKYNNNHVGVYYNGTKWTIFNENKAINMKLGLSFNVMVMSKKTNSIKKYIMNDQVLHVFPNPADAGSNLELTISDKIDGKLKIEILDITGRVLTTKSIVKSSPIRKENFLIDHLTKGVYILRVHNSNVLATQRFIVE